MELPSFPIPLPRAYVVPARTVMEEMATTASRKAAPHKKPRRGIVLVEYMPKRYVMNI
ncbi:hypothetical protein BKA82DRAFT_1007435 [Pisolithus tinctorius]|uniref:Uncharacterized protein n=1 Tax=Pisolithus tinctorius Marx 270 TaxID=870435 RepID=A0A0C3IEL6_PISTI|nr:hypothetical protein BKA82DRAFT_1007435 [Pisolithus tinctorius]KIN95472.1 hypothetical protein M404DRAFT_1007435 [Pisolithus tinctorius Marx 270]